MKTIEINLYKFNELSDKAKENAVNEYLSNGWEYFWSSENEETLNAFAGIFPVRVSNWEYGYHNFINYTITCNEDIAGMRGLRLYKYIMNNYYSDLFKPKYIKHLRTGTPIYHHRIKVVQISSGPNKGQHINTYRSGIEKSTDCVLTGYGGDMSILAPIYKFLKNPCKYTSFADLLNDCLNGWLSGCTADYEYSQSFEAISEHLQVNEYDFTEDGKLY